MDDSAIRAERAQNLWSSFTRQVEPLARATEITGVPELTFDGIGGLNTAKEEILTYACAVTNPEVYANWGTFPPSGVLMVGAPGVGKQLLATALAQHAQTALVHVDVPRMVLDVVRSGPKVPDFVKGWSQVLEEVPPLTIHFDELEFSGAQDVGSPRTDLPIGPIMDFLLELIDRTTASQKHLVVGSTGYPDTLRHGFARPGRLERVIEVTPRFPEDIIAALHLHAGLAEKRAGRTLFEGVNWGAVDGTAELGATGDWVRILHAVLRRKARSEASGDLPSPITEEDLGAEVQRFDQASRRIQNPRGGTYV